LQGQIRALSHTARAGGKTLMERHEFLLRLARYDAELKAITVMVQRVAAMEADHSPAAHA
ncbi:MAG TPA: acyl-CoA dehydrogenase, partial [Cupriavidus sp.]|nr:acyl-CoA dehydrogenase [Cupriavidus sp.]